MKPPPPPDAILPKPGGTTGRNAAETGGAQDTTGRNAAETGGAANATGRNAAETGGAAERQETRLTRARRTHTTKRSRTVLPVQVG